jgi:hypothetical protein
MNNNYFQYVLNELEIKIQLATNFEPKIIRSDFTEIPDGIEVVYQYEVALADGRILSWTMDNIIDIICAVVYWCKNNKK